MLTSLLLAFGLRGRTGFVQTEFLLVYLGCSLRWKNNIRLQPIQCLIITPVLQERLVSGNSIARLAHLATRRHPGENHSVCVREITARHTVGFPCQKLID